MSKENNINIELYLLCYNEERMIVHTLNYYSKICSKIIIIDNGSIDSSLKLAKKYANIEIRHLKTNDEYVEDLLVESRNNCWKESTADYVIVCDMDEFLYDENLESKLLTAKNNGVIIPMVIGYNMMSDYFPEDYDRPITKQVQEGLRDKMFDKNIIFDPKKVKDINYGPGSHQCNPLFYEDRVVDPLIEFKLLHYKYIDKEYICKKHEKYSKRMSTVSKEKRHGYEYLLGNGFIEKVFSLSDYLIKVVN
jgi:glycosyltransferase involved in cell wall biosynthesis